MLLLLFFQCVFVLLPAIVLRDNTVYPVLAFLRNLFIEYLNAYRCIAVAFLKLWRHSQIRLLTFETKWARRSKCVSSWDWLCVHKEVLCLQVYSIAERRYSGPLVFGEGGGLGTTAGLWVEEICETHIYIQTHSINDWKARLCQELYHYVNVWKHFNRDDFPLTNNENTTFKIRILHQNIKKTMELFNTEMWA